MITTVSPSHLFFSSLDDLLNQQHPLYKLSSLFDWKSLETVFTPLYCDDNGQSAKPIRLMCDLFRLKHFRNISDKSVVEQWSEKVLLRLIKKISETIIERNVSPNYAF